MIGVSNLEYSYPKVTTASAGGLNFSRFNLPQSSLVECLGGARWEPSQDPLRPRAHWGPRGWNARRPRRRRLAPTGPRTELAWQRAILRCGGPRSAQVALLPGQHLEPADRLERPVRLGRDSACDLDGVLQRRRHPRPHSYRSFDDGLRELRRLGLRQPVQRPRRRVVRCSHALQLRDPREPPGLGRWRHTERRGRAPVVRWALAHADAALRPMCRPVADVPLHVLARGPLRDRRDRVPWGLRPLRPRRDGPPRRARPGRDDPACAEAQPRFRELLLRLRRVPLAGRQVRRGTRRLRRGPPPTSPGRPYSPHPP